MNFTTAKELKELYSEHVFCQDNLLQYQTVAKRHGDVRTQFSSQMVLHGFYCCFLQINIASSASRNMQLQAGF